MTLELVMGKLTLCMGDQRVSLPCHVTRVLQLHVTRALVPAATHYYTVYTSIVLEH